MTRASLLRILDNLGGISETEVQELEQLAAAFPYCQTAHLLLAKAAHDRGSMLAAQRLRRAATYAVDRQRLRTLIELPAPLPPAQLAAPADATRVAPAPVLLEIAPQPAPATIPDAEPELLPDAELREAEATTAPDTDNAAALQPTEAPLFDALAAAAASEQQEVSSVATPALSEAEQLVVVPLHSGETQPAAVSTAENAPQPDSAVTFAVELPAASADEPSTEQANSELVTNQEEPGTRPETEITTDTGKAFGVPVTNKTEPESVPEQETLSPESPEAVVVVASAVSPIPSDADVAPHPAEEELPLVAPLIRFPVEEGSSRFEFGLAEPLARAMSTYNLFDVEKAPAKSSTVIPSFWADEEVGYAPGLGSRLGFCLQAQDEYTLDLPPSAFFAPDALLLAHLKQHKPVPPPVPKSIDLIDKFLRSKPRFKAPLPLPPTTEAQADLSVRSTVAEPGLASESLARILARQGKIAKAIEIYERLIVRQPEKKAYFADQIQQLQTHE